MQIPAASTPPANGQSQAKLSVRKPHAEDPVLAQEISSLHRTESLRVEPLVRTPAGEGGQGRHRPGDEDVEDLYETFSMAMMVSRLLFCARTQSRRRDNTACVCLLQIVVGFPTIFMGTTLLLMIGRIYGG